MFAKKEQKRTAYSIGKEQFNFDFELEKNIYSHVYGILPRKYKKLKEKYEFENYSEWKEYVQNKHKDDSSEKLSDFGRYLQQMNENEEPTSSYWNICIPIFMSLIITNIPEMIKDFQEIDFSGMSILFIIICVLIICALITPLIIYLLYNILLPLWECNLRKNLLRDYREIIDVMIKNKIKEEKKLDKKKNKDGKKK